MVGGLVSLRAVGVVSAFACVTCVACCREVANVHVLFRPPVPRAPRRASRGSSKL